MYTWIHRRVGNRYLAVGSVGGRICLRIVLNDWKIQQAMQLNSEALCSYWLCFPVPRQIWRCFFCRSFLLCKFQVCLCYAVLFVPCLLGRGSPLCCLVCDVCLCFCHFHINYGVPFQLWCMTVSIPDLCLHLTFVLLKQTSLFCCSPKPHKGPQPLYRSSSSVLVL